jgi:hypothetical protein
MDTILHAVRTGRWYCTMHRTHMGPKLYVHDLQTDSVLYKIHDGIPFYKRYTAHNTKSDSVIFMVPYCIPYTEVAVL